MKIRNDITVPKWNTNSSKSNANKGLLKSILFISRKQLIVSNNKNDINAERRSSLITRIMDIRDSN